MPRLFAPAVEGEEDETLMHASTLEEHVEGRWGKGREIYGGAEEGRTEVEYAFESGRSRSSPSAPSPSIPDRKETTLTHILSSPSTFDHGSSG